MQTEIAGQRSPNPISPQGWRVTQVTDAAGADDYHAVLAAAMALDLVGLPADPVEELLPRLDDDTHGERNELWSGYLASTPVAVAEVEIPLRENTDMFKLNIWVYPAHRRQGHGQRMLTAMVEVAHAHGRTRLLAMVPGPLDLAAPRWPGQRFAARAGGVVALGDVRRVLPVATIDRDVLATLVAEGRAGYALEGWEGLVCDDDLDDHLRLRSLMSTDPPQGALALDEEVWDSVRYRANENLMGAQGRLRFGMAVRHLPTGRLVGYTDIGVSRYAPRYAFQWDTIVAGAHRGHRLGLWIKAANLLRLREVAPDTEYVSTWNAADNSFMIAINEQLGFRASERWDEHVFTIAADGTLCHAR